MKVKETQKMKSRRPIESLKQPHMWDLASRGRKSIETPEEARAIGREMAMKVAMKLQLRLTA